MNAFLSQVCLFVHVIDIQLMPFCTCIMASSNCLYLFYKFAENPTYENV